MKNFRKNLNRLLAANIKEQQVIEGWHFVSTSTVSISNLKSAGIYERFGVVKEISEFGLS